jgi:predicted O-methyltransferase YrrM
MTIYPNWFVGRQNNFELYLSSFADKPDLKFLQIGTFTGDASVWMLNNILTDESSTLTDVDTWAGSDEEVHKKMDFNDVHNTYIEKTKNFKNRFWYKGKSVDFMMSEPHTLYDFIYIDGDHTASGVANDAILAWQLLKPNGIMAFDDYVWTHEKGELYEPKSAIDFFCWAKQLELKIIDTNEQLWVQKNDN